jgi:hypothetical protein
LALIVRVLDADAASGLTATLGCTLVGEVTTAIAIAYAGVVAVAGATVALSAARVLAAVHGASWVGACTDFAAVWADFEAVATGNLAENRLATLWLDTDSAAVSAAIVDITVVVGIVDALETVWAFDASEAAAERWWCLASAIVTNTGTSGVGEAAV